MLQVSQVPQVHFHSLARARLAQGLAEDKQGRPFSGPDFDLANSRILHPTPLGQW
jgi:hypothetical protein